MRIVQTDQTSSLNVERVHIVFVSLLCFVDISKSVLDITMTEATPSKMLIDSDILVIEGQGSFIRSLSLLEVFLLFVEEANLD